MIVTVSGAVRSLLDISQCWPLCCQIARMCYQFVLKFTSTKLKKFELSTTDDSCIVYWNPVYCACAACWFPSYCRRLWPTSGEMENNCKKWYCVQYSPFSYTPVLIASRFRECCFHLVLGDAVLIRSSEEGFSASVWDRCQLSVRIIRCINWFTSLCKNLFNLLEILAEAFRCHVHHFQCLMVLANQV